MSFLSYLGGKSLLANRIIQRMPEHHCYCEVFAGGAWVLFKKEPSRVEIINDINADLVTLYRVVKNHLDEFIRYFRWIVQARDEFDRFRKEKPECLTDIQKAVRFYYLLRNGYGSKLRGQAFNISTTRGPNLNLLRIEEELSSAHIRLARVYIENLHYERLIQRFDRPHTWFYLDPPYFGCEGDYGDGIFKREDFANLAGILKGLKGKFLLSINDTPEIRDLFGSFRIEKEGTTYMMNKQSKKKVVELLIMNYKK